MNKHLTVVVFALTLFTIGACTSPVTADSAQASNSESATTETTTGNTATNDPNEMICRREVVTGSNFRREVCMTRAQREEIQRNSQNEIRRNQRSSLETGTASPTQ